MRLPLLGAGESLLAGALRWSLLLIASLLGIRGAQAQTINVFLVGGQSNADGRASLTGLPTNLANPQNDVPFYYGVSNSKATAIRATGFTTLRPGLSNTAQFGPEVSFGRSMADYYEAMGGSIALIKYANGGTTLASDWKAGGDGTTTGDGPIYQDFQTVVAQGMAALHQAYPAATLTITGMIWMQGESDANALSSQYQQNLAAFIADIRATYGANLPFVIGELSVNQTGTDSDAGGTDAQRNAVRAAQVAVSATTPNTAIVNSDAYGLNSDNLHFNTAGQQALGYAFAQQMQNLVAVPEGSSSAILALGLGAITLAYRRKV